MNAKLHSQIALSAGGRPEDLAPYGIGTEHVDELMVQMAKQLLLTGHRLAFGGTLGVEGQSLTQVLIDTSQRWLDESAAKNIDVRDPQTWVMVNYSAWQYYKQISDDYRSRLVGICQFIDIDPPGVSKKILDTAEGAYAKRYTADALTAMRERATQESELRIVWAGRIGGADGWMPGILEEVVMSLKLKKPLLVLGGFGGCARLIADFLKSKTANWPDVFKRPASHNPPRDSLLTSAERQSLHQRFDEAEQLLVEYRHALNTTDVFNSIPTEVQKKVLLEDSMRAVKSEVVATLINNPSKS